MASWGAHAVHRGRGSSLPRLIIVANRLPLTAEFVPPRALQTGATALSPGSAPDPFSEAVVAPTAIPGHTELYTCCYTSQDRSPRASSPRLEGKYGEGDTSPSDPLSFPLHAHHDGDSNKTAAGTAIHVASRVPNGIPGPAPSACDARQQPAPLHRFSRAKTAEATPQTVTTGTAADGTSKQVQDAAARATDTRSADGDAISARVSVPLTHAAASARAAQETVAGAMPSTAPSSSPVPPGVVPLPSSVAPGAHWHLRESSGGLVTALRALSTASASAAHAYAAATGSAGHVRAGAGVETVPAPSDAPTGVAAAAGGFTAAAGSAEEGDGSRSSDSTPRDHTHRQGKRAAPHPQALPIPTLTEAAAAAGFSEVIWVGWCGATVPESDRMRLDGAFRARGCTLVHIPQRVMDGHYRGFCNSLLWPVLHGSQPPLEELAAHGIEWWEAYKAANAAFAAAVARVREQGDVVMIQDFHLALVAPAIAAADPAARIGWFLHTPFPPLEAFKALPWAVRFLKGVLGCSVIGFQTAADARRFRHASHVLLGSNPSTDYIDLNQSVSHIVVSGAAIAPADVDAALLSPSFPAALAQARAAFAGKAVVLGVDRLDPIKGIPHKLAAFEKLLEMCPRLRGRVCLVQIAVPSRAGVGEVERLKETVHGLAGRINGKYGAPGYAPVTLLDTSVSPIELAALYRISRVCYVASTADGMNLVASEYLAAHHLGRIPLTLEGGIPPPEALTRSQALTRPASPAEGAGARQGKHGQGQQGQGQGQRQGGLGQGPELGHVIGAGVAGWGGGGGSAGTAAVAAAAALEQAAGALAGAYATPTALTESAAAAAAAAATGEEVAMIGPGLCPVPKCLIDDDAAAAAAAASAMTTAADAARGIVTAIADTGPDTECLWGGPGVLVLSQFAGAAQTLAAGAIIVIPWDITAAASALARALALPARARVERLRAPAGAVRTRTAAAWAKAFVSTVASTPAVRCAAVAAPPFPSSAVALQIKEYWRWVLRPRQKKQQGQQGQKNKQQHKPWLQHWSQRNGKLGKGFESNDDDGDDDDDDPVGEAAALKSAWVGPPPLTPAAVHLLTGSVLRARAHNMLIVRLSREIFARCALTPYLSLLGPAPAPPAATAPLGRSVGESYALRERGRKGLLGAVYVSHLLAARPGYSVVHTTLAPREDSDALTAAALGALLPAALRLRARRRRRLAHPDDALALARQVVRRVCGQWGACCVCGHIGQGGGSSGGGIGGGVARDKGGEIDKGGAAAIGVTLGGSSLAGARRTDAEDEQDRIPTKYHLDPLALEAALPPSPDACSRGRCVACLTELHTWFTGVCRTCEGPGPRAPGPCALTPRGRVLAPSDMGVVSTWRHEPAHVLQQRRLTRARLQTAIDEVWARDTAAVEAAEAAAEAAVEAEAAAAAAAEQQEQQQQRGQGQGRGKKQSIPMPATPATAPVVVPVDDALDAAAATVPVSPVANTSTAPTVAIGANVGGSKSEVPPPTTTTPTTAGPDDDDKPVSPPAAAPGRPRCYAQNTVTAGHECSNPEACPFRAAAAAAAVAATTAAAAATAAEFAASTGRRFGAKACHMFTPSSVPLLDAESFAHEPNGPLFAAYTSLKERCARTGAEMPGPWRTGAGGGCDYLGQGVCFRYPCRETPAPPAPGTPAEGGGSTHTSEQSEEGSSTGAGGAKSEGWSDPVIAAARAVIGPPPLLPSYDPPVAATAAAAAKGTGKTKKAHQRGQAPRAPLPPATLEGVERSRWFNSYFHNEQAGGRTVTPWPSAPDAKPEPSHGRTDSHPPGATCIGCGGPSVTTHAGAASAAQPAPGATATGCCGLHTCSHSLPTPMPILTLPVRAIAHRIELLSRSALFCGAEAGAFSRRGLGPWRSQPVQGDLQWQQPVLAAMQAAAARVPGARVAVGEASLLFEYSLAPDLALAATEARQLYSELTAGPCTRLPLRADMGFCSVRVGRAEAECVFFDDSIIARTEAAKGDIRVMLVVNEVNQYRESEFSYRLGIGLNTPPATPVPVQETAPVPLSEHTLAAAAAAAAAAGTGAGEKPLSAPASAGVCADAAPGAAAAAATGAAGSAVTTAGDGRSDDAHGRGTDKTGTGAGGAVDEGDGGRSAPPSEVASSPVRNTDGNLPKEGVSGDSSGGSSIGGGAGGGGSTSGADAGRGRGKKSKGKRLSPHAAAQQRPPHAGMRKISSYSKLPPLPPASTAASTASATVSAAPPALPAAGAGALEGASVSAAGATAGTGAEHASVGARQQMSPTSFKFSGSSSSGGSGHGATRSNVPMKAQGEGHGQGPGQGQGQGQGQQGRARALTEAGDSSTQPIAAAASVLAPRGGTGVGGGQGTVVDAPVAVPGSSAPSEQGSYAPPFVSFSPTTAPVSGAVSLIPAPAPAVLLVTSPQQQPPEAAVPTATATPALGLTPLDTGAGRGQVSQRHTGAGTAGASSGATAAAGAGVGRSEGRGGGRSDSDRSHNSDDEAGQVGQSAVDSKLKQKHRHENDDDDDDDMPPLTAAAAAAAAAKAAAVAAAAKAAAAAAAIADPSAGSSLYQPSAHPSKGWTLPPLDGAAVVAAAAGRGVLRLPRSRAAPGAAGAIGQTAAPGAGPPGLEPVDMPPHLKAAGVRKGPHGGVDGAHGHGDGKNTERGRDEWQPHTNANQGLARTSTNDLFDTNTTTTATSSGSGGSSVGGVWGSGEDETSGAPECPYGLAASLGDKTCLWCRDSASNAPGALTAAVAAAAVAAVGLGKTPAEAAAAEPAIQPRAQSCCSYCRSKAAASAALAAALQGAVAQAVGSMAAAAAAAAASAEAEAEVREVAIAGAAPGSDAEAIPLKGTAAASATAPAPTVPATGAARTPLPLPLPLPRGPAPSVSVVARPGSRPGSRAGGATATATETAAGMGAGAGAGSGRSGSMSPRGSPSLRATGAGAEAGELLSPLPSAGRIARRSTSPRARPPADAGAHTGAHAHEHAHGHGRRHSGERSSVDSEGLFRCSSDGSHGHQHGLGASSGDGRYSRLSIGSGILPLSPAALLADPVPTGGGGGARKGASGKGMGKGAGKSATPPLAAGAAAAAAAPSYHAFHSSGAGAGANVAPILIGDGLWAAAQRGAHALPGVLPPLQPIHSRHAHGHGRGHDRRGQTEDAALTARAPPIVQTTGTGVIHPYPLTHSSRTIASPGRCHSSPPSSRLATHATTSGTNSGGSSSSSSSDGSLDDNDVEAAEPESAVSTAHAPTPVSVAPTSPDTRGRRPLAQGLLQREDGEGTGAGATPAPSPGYSPPAATGATAADPVAAGDMWARGGEARGRGPRAAPGSDSPTNPYYNPTSGRGDDGDYGYYGYGGSGSWGGSDAGDGHTGAKATPGKQQLQAQTQAAQLKVDQEQLQQQQDMQVRQWPQADHAYVMLSDGRPRPMTIYNVSMSQEPSFAEFSILNPRGLAAFLDILPK